MTAPREDGGRDAADAASNLARAVGLAATAGAVFIAVYALGSARGWWEGRSCTLGACGAGDIEWAWYGVAAVATVVGALTLTWSWQMFRAPGDR